MRFPNTSRPDYKKVYSMMARVLWGANDARENKDIAEPGLVGNRDGVNEGIS